MVIVRLLYIGYLLLRFSEAVELAVVTYTETKHILLTGTAFFVFVFGVMLVVVGVRDVGVRVALTWHVILELLLIPLSLYFAYSIAQSGNGRLLLLLTPVARFEVSAVMFLAGQVLLAVIGFHILRWTMMANRRCAT